MNSYNDIIRTEIVMVTINRRKAVKEDALLTASFVYGMYWIHVFHYFGGTLKTKRVELLCKYHVGKQQCAQIEGESNWMDDRRT